MKPLELTYYLFAILGAIGSFIGGVSNLLNYWQTKRGKGMGRYTIKVGALIGLLLVVLFAVVMGSIIFAKEKYKNEQLTAEAWNAYNNKNYDVAIEKAKECIIEFQEEALRQEKQIKDANTPNPSKGKTTSEKAKEILQRGLLNDVATCWLIIGMSEIKLGHKDKAISALNKVKQFTYARTYDPSWDGFWSPSDKAEDYIKSLQKELY